MSAKQTSNTTTYIFIIVLCALCAFSLAMISSMLKETQETAVVLDQSKQMLMAAKIIHPEGYFIKQSSKDSKNLLPAKYNKAKKTLELSEKAEPANSDDIFDIFTNRLKAKLVNEAGDLYTFEEAKVSFQDYVNENQASGFAHLQHRLIYEIYSEDMSSIEGYLVPVNGFGLWGPIYGYLAIDSDAQYVKGISWYNQKETPGLGANIAEPWWQEQFVGKTIFQAPNAGEAQDFSTAPLGINVVRGKVIDLYGTGPKSKNSVDGMSGATITGDGVTRAYKESLSGYKNFLIKLAQKQSK